jgi:hypothetical protein
MASYDAEVCMNAFIKLCEEVENSGLISSEDCQYWVFERGYIAAMDEVLEAIKVVIATVNTKQMLGEHEQQTDRVALH